MNSTRRAYVELFIWSAVALFMELFAIRWLSSDIRAFTVFKTFPLVACFVGFGLGYARVSDKSFANVSIALLLFVVAMKVADSFGFCFWGFPSASVFQWQSLVLVGNSVIYLLMFVVCLLALLVGPLLICMYLGTRIGVLFEESKPLKAYAVNLLGAGAGSLLFTWLSFLGLSPMLLIILPAVILFAFFASCKRWPAAGILAIAVGVMCIPESSANLSLASDIVNKARTEHSVLWSPYQRIDLTRFFLNTAQTTDHTVGVELGVNRAFYQYFFDDSVDMSLLPTHLGKLIEARRTEYRFPFQLREGAKSILVVGAGTGQHVDTALKMGATDVDAVEIDPVILEVGSKYDPAYSSPYVHKICDDARHYFNTCKKKYDLVIFSVLDSHTVAGQGSSVRLDSYVYTKQSFQKAASLLNPDGVLYISYASFRPQIEARLYNSLKDAYGGDVYCYKRESIQGDQNSNFALGRPLANHAVPVGWKRVSPPVVPMARSVLTDDWPYLYVDPTVIDGPYLTVIAIILLLSILLARKNIFHTDRSPLNWQLFFLGSGFLLLELSSIAKLSLLYGSTWLTSAIVINIVLCMLFCANLVAMRVGNRLNAHITYLVLGALILVSWGLPTNHLADLSASWGPGGSFLVGLITLSPMLAAGLIFPQAFANSPSPAVALTFNILGSVLGGLLEYLSYFFGISSLMLVSGALYFISYLCFRQVKQSPAVQKAVVEQLLE